MNIDHRKLHRQLRKKSSDRVAADLREKEKKDNYKQFDKRDSYLFDKGIEWFESGLSLDDAHDDMKNNTNFVNGFNKAKRLNDINNMLYNDGKEFFRSGCKLENASDKMKNNKYFIQGYNDEKLLSHSHKL